MDRDVRGAPDELGLATFGETMALLTSDRVAPLRHATTLRLGIGGAESNVAIGLARLGHATAWMGRVGQDELGSLVLSRIRGEGVDVAAATIDDDAPTGLMIKGFRAGGAVQVTYYRRGSAASRLTPAHLDLELIRRARLLHVTGITAAISPSARETVLAAVETAREAGTLVSFDPNYRSALWPADEAARCFRDLLPRADIVLAGSDEAELMFGADEPVALVRALRAGGPSQAILKLGPVGAIGLVDDVEVEARAEPRAVLDPVGAGDAFAVGYLAGVLAGAAPGERLDLAGRIAAFVVTVDGDWEGLPTRDELDLLAGAPGATVRR